MKATKYLTVETAISGLVNGILNFAAAYAIFHGHSRIPVRGRGGLLQDTIGETFLVVFLSMMVSSLICRHRRRAGALPVFEDRHLAPGNLYVRALVAGLIFTLVCVSCNAFLLPRMFPDGVTFSNVLLFKTLYGAILGSIATFLAIRRALNEVDSSCPTCS